MFPSPSGEGWHLVTLMRDEMTGEVREWRAEFFQTENETTNYSTGLVARSRPLYTNDDSRLPLIM